MPEFPRSALELDFKPTRPVHPSPADWRDHVIYSLIVDRFDNTKRLRAYKGHPGEHPLPPEDGAGVHGGTIAGITRRLDYLHGLGITTLWLSPVFKNRVDPGGSLHGYAIQHFLAIDPRFGTKEDLRGLVDEAHSRGMYVILDIVINHTADNWGYEGDMRPTFSSDGTRYPFGFWRTNHPPESFDSDDAVWPAELQDPDCYTRRGAITDWHDPEQAVHGDFFNLKDLDLDNPSTLETLIAIYKYWIVESDIDGYRIDTVKHVSNGAAVKFFNNIKEFAQSIGKSNFFLFGEIVDTDSAIARYVGHQESGSDRLQALDASLDFPLYFVLDEVIKGQKSPAVLRERYESMHATYEQSDGSNLLVTFLDNHDQVSRSYRRFLHDAADDRQALLGIGYLLTSPGIPSIYYGTEQGFDGGGPSDGSDNVIRECMFGGRWGAFQTTGQHFFDVRNPLYIGIAELARIRTTEPALRYGRFYFREVSEDGAQFRHADTGFGFIAYSRILDNDELVVILNVRGEEYANHISIDSQISPPGTLMRDLCDPSRSALTRDVDGRSVLTVSLPSYSVAIFKKPASEEDE